MRRLRLGNQFLRYSEILRVVGQYIERADLGDIRILETDEGLILQGLVMQGERAGERDTYQLTPEDILAMFNDAQAMRATKI
jgi:hypothetical protein